MVNDARFDIVNVTKVLYATRIEAESITLHDTTIRGNVHTSGRRIKELYEGQKDTNCFTDEHKATLDRLGGLTKSGTRDGVVMQRCYQALENHTDIAEEDMPDNSTILCLDDMRKPMYKSKIDGNVMYSSLTTVSPHINVDLGSIMTLVADSE